jgi:hypothetical protein
MADGFIQLPADSVGKKVDTSEITRSDGSLVERERVDIPGVVTDGGDLLRAILVELRLISTLLAAGNNFIDPLDQMRDDLTTTLNTE